MTNLDPFVDPATLSYPPTHQYDEAVPEDAHPEDEGADDEGGGGDVLRQLHRRLHRPVVLHGHPRELGRGVVVIEHGRLLWFVCLLLQKLMSKKFSCCKKKI